MFAIKEAGRVSRIKRERLEFGKRLEDRRSPLPSVADQLGNSECAVSKRGRGHGNRIPSLPVEISPSGIRLVIAPWIASFFFIGQRPVRRPMKLGFGGQSLSAPGCEGAGLIMGDIDRPIQSAMAPVPTCLASTTGHRATSRSAAAWPRHERNRDTLHS